MMSRSMLAVFTAASAGISVGSPLPSTACVGVGCGSGSDDNAMLLQASFIRPRKELLALNQRSSATAHILGNMEELAEKVVSGEEKITDATRLALDSIEMEMDYVIGNATNIAGKFQGDVDRSKQNIEACDTGASTRFTEAGGVNADAASVADARGKHSACRDEEADLSATDKEKCDAFNTFTSDAVVPPCGCTAKAANGGEGFQACVKKLADWSTWTKNNWETKDTECKDAHSAHTRKREGPEGCNTWQDKLESAFCSYEVALSMTCSGRDTCREEHIKLRNEAHASVEISEQAFKAEIVSAGMVKCLLDVLRAVAASQPGDLAACKDKAQSADTSYDTSKLSIAYHGIPSAEACDLTPVEHQPCDDDWEAAEFKGKSWTGKVPVHTCIPCPTRRKTTTTTTTAPVFERSSDDVQQQASFDLDNNNNDAAGAFVPETGFDDAVAKCTQDDKEGKSACICEVANGVSEENGLQTRCNAISMKLMRARIFTHACSLQTPEEGGAKACRNYKKR